MRSQHSICFCLGTEVVMALEKDFEAELVEAILEMLPGAFIIKMDPHMLQGIPDRLILWRDHWALLEVKRSAHAAKRPNQDYYVEVFNEMSFAAFVYPENMEEVLRALQRSFNASGDAFLPRG